MTDYRGEFALFLATIFAAIGWFFSKYAIAGFPSVGFIGLRFFLAALISLPFAYGALRRLSLRHFLLAAAIGVEFALFLGVWILAISNNTNFGSGAFLVSLSMLIAPLLAALLFHHKLTRSFYYAFPIALGGLYCLSVTDGLYLSADSLLYLLTSLLSALYFVLNNHYAKHITILPFISIQMLMVGVICGGYSWVMEPWTATPSAESWGWLALSVVIATNLRFFLQTFGQKHCSIGNAAIIMLLEPVWTLMFSLTLFGEALPAQKCWGCALILGALAIYRLPRRQ